MREENFTVRTMLPAELDIAVQWAEREGWNPGLQDARCFYAADPEGFFIGLLDDLPVACLSAVRYGETFGFMGFYMVEPEYRGRGYGQKIAQAGLRHLAGRSIGLDGVVAQQDNYRRAGFNWAYRNIRYCGLSGEPLQADEGVTPLAGVPFAEVAAYDREVFPAERRDFLRAWISQSCGTALGLVHDGALQGYGVIRQCCEGYKIGPLFADSPDLAEQLFRALSGTVPAGRNVYLDIPEINAAAVALVRRHAMEMVFETARMYLGDAPQIPLQRQFGVTSFELG